MDQLKILHSILPTATWHTIDSSSVFLYQGQFQHPFITKRKTGKIECYGDNDPIACQPSRAKSGAIIAMQCSSDAAPSSILSFVS